VDPRPVGIFDSGAGGLTVLHECLVTMPHEDFVYLGDGARCPYGPRPAGEIRRFALEIASYLEALGVKLILAACNSATAAALSELQFRLSVPVVGVLAPEARAAVQVTRTRRIGVLATAATVASGRYTRAILSLDAGAHVVEVPCPKLVPLIEAGPAVDGRLEQAVREYSGPLMAEHVDTVILGCTHYPLARPVFERVFGRRLSLVFSADETAREVAETLERKDIENDPARAGACRFLTTGPVAEFQALGERFLQLPLGAVERVPLIALAQAAA
jgi:glutamate racemase